MCVKGGRRTEKERVEGETEGRSYDLWSVILINSPSQPLYSPNIKKASIDEENLRKEPSKTSSLLLPPLNFLI